MLVFFTRAHNKSPTCLSNTPPGLCSLEQVFVTACVSVCAVACAVACTGTWSADNGEIFKFGKGALKLGEVGPELGKDEEKVAALSPPLATPMRRNTVN